MLTPVVRPRKPGKRVDRRPFVNNNPIAHTVASELFACKGCVRRIFLAGLDASLRSGARSEPGRAVADAAADLQYPFRVRAGDERGEKRAAARCVDVTLRPVLDAMQV